MSWRRFVEPVVGALPAGSFDALVCGDEVSHGKPHPEPYLRAAELVGFAPGETLAIEDSPTGAASAEAAGCRVLVVPSHVQMSSGNGWVLRETLVGLRATRPRDAARLTSRRPSTHVQWRPALPRPDSDDTDTGPDTPSEEQP